jgi:hypothetical protein
MDAVTATCDLQASGIVLPVLAHGDDDDDLSGGKHEEHYNVSRKILDPI